VPNPSSTLSVPPSKVSLPAGLPIAVLKLTVSVPPFTNVPPE